MFPPPTRAKSSGAAAPFSGDRMSATLRSSTALTDVGQAMKIVEPVKSVASMMSSDISSDAYAARAPLSSSVTVGVGVGVGVVEQNNVNSFEKAPRTSQVFYANLNGTWELSVSLRSKAPYTARRYEVGDVRRMLLSGDERSIEYVPTMWGLSTASSASVTKWNKQLSELTFTWEKSERYFFCFFFNSLTVRIAA